MSFAEFKVAVIGPDGRPGKATRLRADTDDPGRGDVILLAGAWHEVLDVAHVPDENKRPRTVGTVVFVQRLASPPEWLRELEASGGAPGRGGATSGSGARGSRLVQLTVIDGGGSDAAAAADPFAAVTVRQEASFSQMATLARVDNVPRYIDDTPVGPLRLVTPAPTTIEHVLPSPRPTPAAAMTAPDLRSPRGPRPERALDRVFPLLLIAALAAAVLASYFFS